MYSVGFQLLGVRAYKALSFECSYVSNKLCSVNIGFCVSVFCVVCVSFLSNRKTVMWISECGMLFYCTETRPPAPTDQNKALCGCSLFREIARTSPRSVVLPSENFQLC